MSRRTRRFWVWMDDHGWLLLQILLPLIFLSSAALWLADSLSRR